MNNGTLITDSHFTVQFERLSPRLRSIAVLIPSGMTNRQIGVAVGTTENVVKKYMKMLLDKLGAETKLQLAVLIAEMQVSRNAVSSSSSSSNSTMESWVSG